MLVSQFNKSRTYIVEKYRGHGIGEVSSLVNLLSNNITNEDKLELILGIIFYSRILVSGRIGGVFSSLDDEWTVYKLSMGGCQHNLSIPLSSRNMGVEILTSSELVVR